MKLFTVALRWVPRSHAILAVLAALLVGVASTGEVVQPDLLAIFGRSGQVDLESWFSVSSLGPRGQSIALAYPILVGLAPPLVGASVVGPLVDSGRMNYLIVASSSKDRLNSGLALLGVTVIRYVAFTALILVVAVTAVAYQAPASTTSASFSTAPIRPSSVADILLTVGYLTLVSLPFLLLAAALALVGGSMASAAITLLCYLALEMAAIVSWAKPVITTFTPNGYSARWWQIASPDTTLRGAWIPTTALWTVGVGLGFLALCVTRPAWVGRVHHGQL